MNRALLAIALLTSAAPLAAQEHQHHSMPPAEQPAPPPPANTDATVPAAVEQPVLMQPAPIAPTDHVADAYWDPAEMARAREQLRHESGDFSGSRIKVDRFERVTRRGQDGYQLDADAWLGGDLQRIAAEVEGEATSDGALEALETQLHYWRAISPYFNLRAGVRHDFRPRPQRSYAALGIEGLAPYWFDVEAMLFLSTRGRLSARLEGSLDQRLTQKLIVQPRAEVNLAAQDDRAIGVGAGLSDVELGVRLRYEISPQFAPYVGVEWSRSVGRTARFRRAEGEHASSVGLVTGIRFWF